MRDNLTHGSSERKDRSSAATTERCLCFEQERCRAVTVKGDRCKRKALPGSSPELCNEHQLRARRTTQPMVPRWAVAA